MRGRGPSPDPGPDPFADGLPTLVGRAATLRQPRASDAPALFSIFGDAETLRYWSHGPLADLAAAQSYYDGIVQGLADRTLFQWAITADGDDHLVGTVTLVDWDRANRRCEIGFILNPSAWGRGLATDAVRTVIRWAREHMEIHRVEADVEPPNVASLKLLERLGFEREGYFRQRWWTRGRWTDSVMLGLLTDQLAEPTDEG